jgi:hypothetical protein
MPSVPVIKVLVTHQEAARAKYGRAGWTKIRHAVAALIKADQARGITTRLYALDSAADAKKVQAQPVSAPTDVAAIKAAIDQISAVWQPAYLVLLGGPDLVGTVSLTNPLWTGNPADDPDQFIASDLPYACEGSLTLSPADYRGPTRVVGRLPDLVGDADPGVLISHLSAAAQGKSLLRGSPEPAFAISAKVWQRSTQLSVAGLPDVICDVRTAPPDGPAWTAAEMAPAIHFVNCHGAEFDPNWYGQLSPNNWNLPIAIAASGLPGLVPRGAVVASECCYGTSHWPPAAAHGQSSVAMSYLREGAAGVFGASTVAYGPAASNAYADVICRLFVSEVLGGASLGRAVLVARQQFVQAQAFLDPTDLKTLAQFTLFGDPAAVPFVTSPPTPALPRGRRLAAPKSVPTPATSPAVLMRRGQLASVGAALFRSTFACADVPRRRAGLTATALATLLGRALPGRMTIRTFDAGTPAEPPAAAQAVAHNADVTPRAHVAYLPRAGTRPPSLVVVREAGAEPEVRVVERKL